MRLIRASGAFILVASLILAGCGGGDSVTQNPLATAPDTAAASGGTGGTDGSGGSGGGGAGTGGGTPSTVTASARLSWVAPTQNSNGSALTDLAGYNIYYGTDASALTQTIQVPDPSALGYVVTGLATGTTWYFKVTSYSNSGEESVPSPISSKTT